MTQLVKWDDTVVTDLRLNEQTIFWGTTDPASGLPTNSWFFNTTQGVLKHDHIWFYHHIWFYGFYHMRRRLTHTSCTCITVFLHMREDVLQK